MTESQISGCEGARPPYMQDKPYGWERLEGVTTPATVGKTVLAYNSTDATYRRRTITGVTAKGWFYLDNESRLYRPCGTPAKDKKWCNWTLTDDTPDNVRQLEWRKEQREIARKEKEEAARVRQQEREAEQKRELEEVRQACGSTGLNILHQYNAPSGHTVYTVLLPVHSGYENRKLGWELLTVSISPVQKDWMEHPHREVAMTATSGRGGSFGSWSAESFPSTTNTQDILWHCASRAYHHS